MKFSTIVATALLAISSGWVNVEAAPIGSCKDQSECIEISFKQLDTSECGGKVRMTESDRHLAESFSEFAFPCWVFFFLL